ncbi:MAG: hypothetical protein P0S94_03860, partial [Simkaniaceae bacterium]|nr:hypothetical protein [Simkaniaceae bacterium]
MNDSTVIVFLIQVVVTLVMVGVIWFVQIIHYPLYRKIKEGFVQYERAHLRRMAYFAGPLMLIEAITAVMLILMLSKESLISLAIVNLVLLVLIWLSTLLFSVGTHQKLSTHFSNKTL